MTTTVLGKVMLLPRGDYSPSATYNFLDLVTYEGSSFVALKTVTGVTPVDDGVNYQLSASKGEDTSIYGLDSGTANAYAATFAPAVTALTDGLAVRFKAANANTGASTFAPNGLPAKAVLGGAQVPLQGGEIVADGQVGLVYNATLDAWTIAAQSGGALQTADATQSAQAVSHGQIQDALGNAAGFQQQEAGSVLRNFQSKASDIVNVADYDSVAHAAAAATSKPIIYGDGTFGGITQSGNKNQYRNLIGVLRNDGTGWAFLNNSAHAPVGFDLVAGVAIVGNALRITYNFAASHVGTLLVAPDETFALLGITAGGSVGTTYTDIFMSAPLRFTVDCTTNNVVTTSIFSGLITASSLNGITTISHPSCTAEGPAATTSLRRTDGQTGAYPTCGYADQATYIEHNTNMAGIVAYDGSTWNLTTDMDTTRTPVTFSWVPATSRLVVTHPPTMNAYDVQITQRGALAPRLSAVAGTITNTTFSVQFYDSTGALATTQSTDMNFSWQRSALVKSNLTSNGLYTVDRGFAELDPAQLVSSTGNFWLYGVMESASH